MLLKSLKMDKYKKQLDHIKSNWEDLEKKQKYRIRDASKILNVSEAELLSTKIDSSVKFLKINNYHEFKNELINLQSLMFLVRNESVVHEKIVKTKTLTIDSQHSSLVFKNNNFLLNLSLKSIEFIFSESTSNKGNKLNSFQFFDKNGNAILKIYLKSNLYELFNSIVEKYNCKYSYELQKNSTNNQNKKTTKIIDKFNNWDKESLIDNQKLREALLKYSALKAPINLFVFNEHCIQHHFGKIHKIVDFKGWLNVLDPMFNIHIQENEINNKFFIYTHPDNKTDKYIVFIDKDNNFTLGICINKYTHQSIQQYLQS